MSSDYYLWKIAAQNNRLNISWQARTENLCYYQSYTTMKAQTHWFDLDSFLSHQKKRFCTIILVSTEKLNSWKIRKMFS